MVGAAGFEPATPLVGVSELFCAKKLMCDTVTRLNAKFKGLTRAKL